MAEGQVSELMAHEYVQLSTFVASEDDLHGLCALLRNRDWIFAQYIRGWNPQPPVPFCNNTASDPHQRSTNGMTIEANVHHSTYLQNASFLRARRLLMHDLDEPYDEAAERFLRTDPDVEPESLNVCPETPQEVAG